MSLGVNMDDYVQFYNGIFFDDRSFGLYRFFQEIVLVLKDGAVHAAKC
jgi:hypothetical protein